MRVQIVQVSHSPSGVAARRVSTLEVERVTLGRGTDNEVSLTGLSVSLHHARISMRGASLWVEVVDAPSVLVNRRPRQSERLRPGDVLRIGHTELRVMPNEPGVDLVLEVEETERPVDERSELAKRTTLGVERGLLTRRKLSWAAVLSVLGIFLGLPLLSTNQASWNSGPVSNKHSFIEDQCERCHDAFRAVRDDGCRECHFATAPHTADDAAVAGLVETRCATCHIEHTGSDMLADLGEPLCASCHASIQDTLPTAAVGDASDFGEHHPDFRLHVVVEPGGERQRAVWRPDLEERSGLDFSHLRHVGQRLPTPDGSKAILSCDRCHSLGEGGTTMRPIDFEETCQECHLLTFDDLLPGREAFHGDPALMRQRLRELYSDQVVRGEVSDERAPRALRFRRPGAPIEGSERKLVEDWVERKVGEASRHLMVRPGECDRCHEVLPGAASDGGPGVAPVEVAEVWMPRSEFRHETHAPFACRDCHAAAAVYDPEDAPDLARPEWSLPDARPYGLRTPSELRAEMGLEPSVRSSDVLLPSIERCRTCHGGQTASPPLVASGCGMCHPFHRKEHLAEKDLPSGTPVRIQSGPGAVAPAGG